MRLFVAAHPDSPDLSTRTVPGELVRLSVEPCDHRPCECDGALFGLATGQPTSVATVRDLDIERGLFVDLLAEALLRDGHRQVVADTCWLEEFATEHIGLADCFQPEDILDVFSVDLGAGDEPSD